MWKTFTQKQLRMRGYDYASDGAYFVTMVTKNRKCYFGDVVKGEMRLSEMGRIADRCWKEIPNHFDNVILDEYKVMPNHVHGIVCIMNLQDQHQPSVASGHAAGTRHVVSLLHNNKPTRKFGPLPPKSLHTIIGSYKSAVTKLIHQQGDTFAWQSRFHDHIIRNERELKRIREYIHNNAAKWEFDRENPSRVIEKTMKDSRRENPAGLCPNCKHMFPVKTGRGNIFIMCKLSKTDRTFPKYPKLPVHECRGYELNLSKRSGKVKSMEEK